MQDVVPKIATWKFGTISFSINVFRLNWALIIILEMNSSFYLWLNLGNVQE